MARLSVRKSPSDSREAGPGPARSWLACALGALLPLLVAAPLAAQEVVGPAKGKRIEATEPEGGKSDAPKMAASGTVSNQQLFTDYYTFRLAEFTWAENANKLPELRKRLRSDMRKATGDAHSQLNNLVLTESLKVAKDPEFSWVARVNAVIMIGELNEREPSLGSSSEPVPLPAARSQLLALSALRSPKSGVDDALAAAALSGLWRHARSALDDAARRELAPVMFTLATNTKRPKFRSEEAQYFLRMRALDILGELHSPDLERGDAKVMQTCLEMVQESPAPLWFRTQAAANLGKLNFQDSAKVNFSLAGKLCAELALTAVDKKIPRRGLSTYLQRIDDALKGSDGSSGMARVASGDHKAYLDELISRIELLESVVIDRKIGDDEMYSKLDEPVRGLTQWLKEKPVEPTLLAGLPPLSQ